MFDFRGALASINGTYEFEELRKQLQAMKRDHLGEIAPEIGISELLRIAKERGWIEEDESGKFHVKAKAA